MKEYIYGKNTVKEAMLSNKKAVKLFVSKNNEEFITLAKKKNISFNIVDNGYLNKIVDGNHQGVVLEIEGYTYSSVDDIIKELKSMVVNYKSSLIKNTPTNF